MSQMIKFGAGSLAGLAFGLLLAASPVWADMQVMDSNVPEIKVGSTLNDDAQVNLPKGAIVRLLDASGATKTLKGPFEGTVANYKASQGWWERLTGGKQDPEPPMGATRGLVKPAQ